MDALTFFLGEHARVHSAAVAQAEGVALEDLAFASLTEEQARARPRPSLNSLAWLVWHMARCEDFAINLVVARQPQVIDEDDWAGQLGLSLRDIATGMNDAEVSDISARIDIPALREYRAAVGRRTREVAATLSPSDWVRVVSESEIEAAATAGAFGPNAGWVKQFWNGRTAGWFLSWLAVGHNNWHFGEANCVRSEAGLGLGF